jgi:hypothetical protein
MKEGCVGELEDEIIQTWTEVQAHVRTKKIQSNLFQQIKNDQNCSMLQIDFAMSYTCEFQNEIQSALWSRQSVNLFTYMKSPCCL